MKATLIVIQNEAGHADAKKLIDKVDGLQRTRGPRTHASADPFSRGLRALRRSSTAPTMQVQRFLQSAIAGGVALLERRFRDGISAGEIPSDFPVSARATQVTDLARGLTMRAQLGMARKTLLKDTEEAAHLVLLPPRA